MIDQEYQSRLPEGMVRCYLVRDRVAGFGEQLVNMLYPAPAGVPASEAPLPGPRLYYPPTRADFQALKDKLEREWVDELCRIVGLEKSQLPVLWDADFLYGPKDARRCRHLRAVRDQRQLGLSVSAERHGTAGRRDPRAHRNQLIARHLHQRLVNLVPVSVMHVRDVRVLVA